MLQSLSMPRAEAPIDASHLLAALPLPVLLLNEDDAVDFANAAAAELFGEGAIGRLFSDVFPQYRRAMMVDAGSATVRLIARDDRLYHASSDRMGDGRLCICLSPAESIPQPGDGHGGDDLTGLATRAALMASLSEALAGARRTDAAIAVHYLDLDRFKIINDTLGHGLGDQLLRKVAERLRSACRDGDVIARMGGDEFVILQRDVAGRADVSRLAARLVDLIGRTYVLNGHTINIGASVGVAPGEHDMQAGDLLRQADLALYEAKRAGRGRFRFFEPIMDEQLRFRRELEIDLRRALALKQFELHYQPFLDVATDKVIGFEALLRWRHPQRGDVPPLDFIPVAEENGLIVRIGDWALATACRAATEWPEDMIVAVNVSPVQFKADTLLATVSAVLRATGLAAHRLEIEITESALLDNTEGVLATLHALRDLGVRISMDDFGTGYSSLSYLQKFPFDKIKIDRSFVIGDDTDSKAILKAVSGLGANLGMSITAEGVETAEQLARIRDHRCTHVQGYLTGRPMAPAAIAPFLSSLS